MRLIMIAAVALAAAACASASKPGAMVAPVTEGTMIAENSALKEAFSVGTVTGGKKTSPLWKSNVSSEDFAEALRQSLAAHAMLAASGGKYTIDAELVELKQPMVAVNSKVTSVVGYKVTDTATGAVVFSETITNAYTAKLGDALLGVERLRLANEGSIKGNIAQLIERLVAKLGAAPAALPAAVEEPAPQS